ncbi:spore germination protein KC [Gracilibacillus orientalis]|uniref:Spore germination protein KC n=1 Tax=Gracilibacillus orientalis TaxID=334253 RepID=A0A1I4LMP1_9BACI|nr:Ger(x)C family spore germination protein [Gracilibacillus orientalis]SFL92220.1 spore germination protein KC [Gracilibacillus orientalis]
MKRFRVWLLCSSLCLLLTGCWSAQELTDITLAKALAIDKDGEDYKVTIQVLNPGEIAGDQLSTRATISTYSASGRSIFEAIRKLTKSSPRKVHLSHLQLVVYGEETAKEGIGKTLDFLIRDHEVRTDFTIAIAKGLSGDALISILTPLEKIPADKVRSSVESSEDFWAPTKEVKLDELIESISSNGKEAILTGVYLVGSPDEGTKMENTEYSDSPAQIYLDDIGVFRGDKLQGWLNEKESKGFNYITDNVTNTIGWVDCNDGGTISVEVFQSNTNMQGSVVNGEPSIKIDIKIKANIGDVECSLDLSKPKTIQDVQKKLEQKTINIAEASISAAQEYRSDIFGFGNAIRRSNPKKWEQIKDNWNTIYPDLNVDVQAQVEIKKSGMITQPIYEKIERKTEKEE